MLPGLFVRAGSKMKHVVMPSSLPYFKITGDASWGGRSVISRNKFIGFGGKSAMGKNNVAFGSNPYASDYIPLQEFFMNEFVDMESE